MARIAIPFNGPRHKDRNVQVNDQRSINWYPTLEGSFAKSALVLRPTPGLVLVNHAGNGPCRSNFVEFQGGLYFVTGGELYKMDTLEAVTSIGALNTNSGRCYITAGTDYLLAVDGGDGYTYDGATFTAGVGGSFPANPSYCGFLDGFFVALEAGSDQWNISAQENPTSWGAADFLNAEAEPDDAVAVVSTYRDLYIIGVITTQVYYNSGNADFPFDLYPNGVLEFGTPAPASVARVGGNIFMLAQQKGGAPTVTRLSGFQSQRISDDDIAYTLSNSTVSNAEGIAYIEADQTFYELTLPTDNITLVYHLEQNMWHERSSGSAQDVSAITRHRILGYGRFNGKHYVGDYESNNLYALDSNVFTEAGVPVRRVRRMAVMHREGRQIEVNGLELEFVRGQGLESGQGENPQAMMRYSRDGGNTWSKELWRPMGKLGDYTRRAIWNRLGQMSDFRAEIAVSDPIDASIINGYADVEVLVP